MAIRAFEVTTTPTKTISETTRKKPELGPNDVLVRMKAASLNYRDLLIVKGLYGRLKLPIVPLSDGAGEVVEVGSHVKRVRKGDGVMPIFMQRWISGQLDPAGASSALGGAIDGVLQEEAIFNEEGLVRIPEGYSFEEAATLPCAAVTAWNALFETGDVKPGNTVLTLGTGGVSIFALQFATAAGARVAITSSSDEKLERAKKLGAAVCVNYKTHSDWDEQLSEFAPNGVDHVIELGGAGTLDRSIKAARLGGHVSLIGVLAQGTFDPIRVLMKGIRLQGIFVGSREMFEHMNAAITANKIKPVIDRTFKVDQINEALEYMASGSHFGKVVLKF